MLDFFFSRGLLHKLPLCLELKVLTYPPSAQKMNLHLPPGPFLDLVTFYDLPWEVLLNANQGRLRFSLFH